ncbi:hypothetical protein PDE_07114 [Penicillium oxalicum 114-2]|uniref:Uncharacterized protein n=1 Tax=Penicillium oxalicum (strain 114-2 / CGMCC 5302) TaxID=933388 RepID=S7ZP43_PENO1|nr:hypothetical protein PDE_07114 [Penicillium oxalicum 114-2]
MLLDIVRRGLYLLLEGYLQGINTKLFYLNILCSVLYYNISRDTKSPCLS